jgi:SAM-dependent methyltransferase
MRTCRVCGSHAGTATTDVVSNGYRLHECCNCGTTLVEEGFDWNELPHVYDELFEHGGYEQHRREFQRLLEGQAGTDVYRRWLFGRAARRVGKRRVVEIGGGTGTFGYWLASKGWRYKNFDLSDTAVHFCHRLGLEAEVITPQDLSPISSESANVLVMWEVLEHLWNANEYLKAARQGLAPRGILILSTPNYLRSGYKRNLAGSGPSLSRPPIHVNFFTLRSLRTTLEGAGFSIRRVFGRRLNRPPVWTADALSNRVRILLGLEEPMELYAVAEARNA